MAVDSGKACDMLNSDPKSASSFTTTHAQSPFKKPPMPTMTMGDRNSKRSLMHNQNAARMADGKKSVSYAQLARSFHELAASSDQKKSRRELVHHVFPKLAIYNSVDPSLAPSLLMLGQQCEDRTILRYVYYYLARILSDNSGQGLTSGGGIPTPNFEASTDIDSVGGVTRAEVVPIIVDWLSTQALNADPGFHTRRLQALKALTNAPSTSSEILSKLYGIIFSILEKVSNAPDMRKKGIFGASKESIIGSNLQYAAISALRRLPLDLDNPLLLHRVVQGISFADPVAVRHALEMTFVLASKDPYAAAMALGKLVQPGVLEDVIHSRDVLARVSLARLCNTISRAKSLNERPDIKSQFNNLLYQLLIDPSDTVCFEAITCVLGKYDSSDRMEERALGWYSLTREFLQVPRKTDKSSKKKYPQLLIKLVIKRLKISFRSSSLPLLHAAARVVQEMGKSQAAAFTLGLLNTEGDIVNAFSKSNDWDHVNSESEDNDDTVNSLLTTLMEVVRTTAACECVYVRAMVIKALIWIQTPNESSDELELIIASEISDSCWSPTLLNDVLLTLHARFKATPDMAVILLEIARIFATKVPGKIDADVLQLLWKTCLVGAGPNGKHTALEAVTLVLDLPPPQPGSMSGITLINRVSASEPKSALALQRLVQAAVWFLGENANYAASEYAWESVTPPGTALMMLDADKMVAAAGSRNPTLVCALNRLQRCTFSCSWEVRITAAQALTTIAIRSGEPYRLQIYEFLHALAEGGVQYKLSDIHISNGEDQVASGSGLGSLLSPALKVLDEMYKAQDELIKEMRNHDNVKREWTDEELKKLYETHERLLNLVSLFCYVPRAKYLPLGPVSAKLIDIYRHRHNISAYIGLNDPTVATGISELIYEATKQPPAAVEPEPETFDDDLVNAWAVGLADDGLWGNNTPAMNRVNKFLSGSGTDAPDVDDVNIFAKSSNDDMWAKTLLEPSELDYDESSSSSSPSSIASLETSASSQFGGMNYPSLFSSKSQHKNKEESTDQYSSRFHKSYKFEENHLDETVDSEYSYHDEDRSSSGNIEFGTALYDFTAGGDDEMSLEIGEELEIEYEVDGWFYVKKLRPGWDGKIAGLVPVLYVNRC